MIVSWRRGDVAVSTVPAALTGEGRARAKGWSGDLAILVQSTGSNLACSRMIDRAAGATRTEGAGTLPVAAALPSRAPVTAATVWSSPHPTFSKLSPVPRQPQVAASPTPPPRGRA